METRMAKCPKCGKVIKWSWEQDVYVIDSNYASEIKLSLPSEVKEELTHKCEHTAQICPCGHLLGVMVEDPEFGAYMLAIPEFNGVDWELDENSCQCEVDGGNEDEE